MTGKKAQNTKKNACSRMRKIVATGGLALGLGILGVFADSGNAAAGSWPADSTYPAPPSYPADPSWPSPPPGWGSYPAAPSWPGDSSHPCCSR